MQRIFAISGASLVGLGLSVGHSITMDPEAKHAWTVVKRFPWNAFSRVTGRLAEAEVPLGLRKWLYGGMGWVVGADFTEAAKPIEAYTTFQELFTRRLKGGARPIAQEGMTSPCDGRVLHFGELDVVNGMIEAVKGSDFGLEEFLGPHQVVKPESNDDDKGDKKLFFCTIYLAPGDYHGVHAPAAMAIDGRRHFPGMLMPVAPFVVGAFRGLFAMNERIVLFGRWKHGFMAVTPVGATNVGTISLDHEPLLVTNTRGRKASAFYDKEYNNVNVQAGDRLAMFNLGSTVVLIFEAPTFQFFVKPGQRLKLGESIGDAK